MRVSFSGCNLYVRATRITIQHTTLGRMNNLTAIYHSMHSLACRQGAWPIPAETTHPMKASTILISASTPVRERAPFTAIDPRTGAVIDESDLRNLPIGVLAKLTMTGVFMMVVIIRINECMNESK